MDNECKECGQVIDTGNICAECKSMDDSLDDDFLNVDYDQYWDRIDLADAAAQKARDIGANMTAQLLQNQRK